MINRKNCTGCGACADQCPKGAITLRNDENGCLIPQIDQEKCIGCDLCERACPKEHERQNSAFKQRYFAAFNPDLRIRCKSTSGGVFSVWMEHFMKNGGYVAGVILDEEVKARYVLTKDPAVCDRIRKSKYVQAYPDGIYCKIKQKLDAGAHVLFAGLPCQVHALKLYLGKEYERLLTVDLICFGVVPPAVFEDYIKDKEKKTGKKITDFVFRGRDEIKGWHKNCFIAGYADGTEEKVRQSTDYYFGVFFKNIAIRDSCFVCRYKTASREGDITLGDFWGIEKVAPEMDSNDGVSVMTINTEKGNCLFEKVKGGIEYKELFENVLNFSSTTRNNKPYKFRKAFLKAYRKRGFSYACFWHVSVYRLLSKIPLLKLIYK